MGQLSPEWASEHRHYIFLGVFTGGWLLMAAIAWFTTIRYEKEKRILRLREKRDGVVRRWFAFKKADGWDDDPYEEMSPMDATVIAFVEKELEDEF